MDNQIDAAVEKFNSGYNCAQAVLYAVAPGSKSVEDMLLKISTGFGAGLGRQQEVCGAVSGAVMSLGLKYGRGSDDNKDKTEVTYAKTREFIDLFIAGHGSIICREILDGCDLKTESGQKIFNDNDYKNIKCVECVKSAVAIVQKL